MITVKCTYCHNEFETYPSLVKKVRNPFCSIVCKGKWQSENLKGRNNPNYSIGQENSFCECGNKKDYRALKCAICAKRSTPKEKGVIPSVEELKNVIADSASFLEAASKTFRSRKWLKDMAVEHNVDISHFKKCNNRLYSADELLVVGDKRVNGTVRALILRENLLEYKCCICGQEPFHCGKALTLQLDHLNGVFTDNRLANLRFLCPNCHTQTETFTGKNMKKRGASVSDGGNE